MKDWGIWQQSIPINTEVYLVDSAWMAIEHCPAEVRLNNFADLIDFVKVVISQKSIKRIINLCISVQVFAATRAVFSDREDLFQLVFCFALFCFVCFVFFSFSSFFYRRNSNCDTDLKFRKAWETVSRVCPRVSRVACQLWISRNACISPALLFFAKIRDNSKFKSHDYLEATLFVP